MNFIFVTSTFRHLFSLACAVVLIAPGDSLRAQDKIIVKVDEVPIYQSEVDRELVRFLARLQEYPPDQAEAMHRQAEQQIVEELIGKLLLVNGARASGLDVTSAEIDERLIIVMKSIAPGGSPESFLKEAGISKDQLSEDVRRNLLLQKLVDLKTKDIPAPTEEQLAAFFEENKARFFQEETVECRHIFLETEGLTDATLIEAKRKQASDLRKMLLENPGLDFARISKEKSDGPTAQNGGYLGFMRQNDFFPAFTKAAFAQEVGKIGEVVRTELGFHLIKVESRSPARQPELAEIKEQVREGMQQRKRGEIMRQYVDERRRGAKIELLIPIEGIDPANAKEKVPK